MQSTTPQVHQATILSVVIVNYRSWPDVLELVTRLGKSPSLASGLCEILIVDNASPEPVPAVLLESHACVRLILKGENSGFSSGVNAGWRAASGRWLLVLNPDIVPDEGLLGRVLERICLYESSGGQKLGIVGFELRNADGSRQPSVGAFPGLLRTAWEQLLPRYRRKYQPEWRLRQGAVDWVTGACMLLSCRMLDDLGGMDEEFFLYYEEVALCRSASERGWAVEYDPGVSVVHLRPLQNRPISPKMRVITRHSKLLYFQKHLPSWQFSTLSVAVRLEARIRGAWGWLIRNPVEAHTWRIVNLVAKRLANRTQPGGRSIRRLAESVEELTCEVEASLAPEMKLSTGDSRKQTHLRPRGSRALPPRKDGP